MAVRIKLEFSKRDVNLAGDILSGTSADEENLYWAQDVLENWRGIHGYPINVFQTTLRDKLKNIDAKAVVAQRLKRSPSIINKLQRFPKMQLARMQDVAGIRAVVRSIDMARELESSYLKSKRFKHRLVKTNDYITNPKKSGYRGYT